MSLSQHAYTRSPPQPPPSIPANASGPDPHLLQSNTSSATESYVKAFCRGVRQIKHTGRYARGLLARPVTAVAQGTASTRRGAHDHVIMVGIRSVRVVVAHILSILSHAATWFDGISEGQLKWASCSGSSVAF